MRVMNTPKSMDLEITSRCNLRCTYCSHFESDGDVGHDLPKEEWLKFFEELNRCDLPPDLVPYLELEFRY